jgi:microcystin-dependent protein
MKGKKINFQTLFNIFVVITISILLYFHFRKKESFEGIAGSSFVSRVPKGTIVAFNGTVAPAGWALCNGENGTPDLRGRFIRMFSTDLPPSDNDDNSTFNSYVKRYIGPNVPDKEFNGNARDFQLSWVQKLQLGDYGGTDLMRLIEKEMPSHSHSIGVGYGDSGGCNIGLFSKDTLACARLGKNNDRQTSDDERGNGPMNYINTSGGNESHNNTPPYYVLAYIMKL